MPTGSPDRAPIAVFATHLAPALGYGGIAEATARVALGWAAAGRPVALCSSDASEGGPIVPADVGMPAGAAVRLYRAMVWPRWGFGPGAVPAILATLRGARAAYVSGVGTWPTSLAGLACRLFRVPFVVGVHGGLMEGHVEHIRRHKPHKWAFYRLITLPTLRAAKAIHATSELEADGVRLLLPDAPVGIVPNAVDLSAWAPLPPRPGAGDGLVLAYVGRLAPEKGILPFLDAWLAARRPGDRLLVAGSGTGAYAAAVADRAARAGGAVELLGYLPAAGVRAVLARADMVVLPSSMGSGGLRENFGIAVIEAMASARPVLVSAGMAWDSVEGDGVGLAFAPDAEGARAAVDRARGLGPARLGAMGSAARTLVEGRYGIEAVAARMWDLVAGPDNA